MEDMKINVKIKLSVLWATLMFIYIYVDIFRFFQPGELENILAGKVWVFDITQTWALSAMIMMTIPSLMVFLSLTLKAKANRWINIIMGILHIAQEFSIDITTSSKSSVLALRSAISVSFGPTVYQNGQLRHSERRESATSDKNLTKKWSGMR